MQIRKGQTVIVHAESGKGIQCNVVDVDAHQSRIWVRLPTDQVLAMNWSGREEVYAGYSAGIRFTVDPEEY